MYWAHDKRSACTFDSFFNLLFEINHKFNFVFVCFNFVGWWSVFLFCFFFFSIFSNLNGFIISAFKIWMSPLNKISKQSIEFKIWKYLFLFTSRIVPHLLEYVFLFIWISLGIFFFFKRFLKLNIFHYIL